MCTLLVWTATTWPWVILLDTKGFEYLQSLHHKDRHILKYIIQFLQNFRTNLQYNTSPLKDTKCKNCYNTFSIVLIIMILIRFPLCPSIGDLEMFENDTWLHCEPEFDKAQGSVEVSIHTWSANDDPLHILLLTYEIFVAMIICVSKILFLYC
jgi:hypothetical protein